MGGSGGLNILP